MLVAFCQPSFPAYCAAKYAAEPWKCLLGQYRMPLITSGTTGSTTGFPQARKSCVELETIVCMPKQGDPRLSLTPFPTAGCPYLSSRGTVPFFVNAPQYDMFELMYFTVSSLSFGRSAFTPFQRSSIDP